VQANAQQLPVARPADLPAASATVPAPAAVAPVTVAVPTAAANIAVPAPVSVAAPVVVAPATSVAAPAAPVTAPAVLAAPVTYPAVPAVPAYYPGYPAAPAVNPWMQYAPPPTFPSFGFNPMNMMGGMGGNMGPNQGADLPPYTMRRPVTQEEKKQLMQMALPMMTGFMGMRMPDSMNYFAMKVKAKPGLSFDEVRDSLFLRANQLNVKKVGENLMWKDFQAVLEDKSAPRIEVYSFCDINVGREILKISPEFVVFLPCRVTIMEDADKQIWVMMLDWNPDWVTGFKERLGLTDKLWNGARDLYTRMADMVHAAANGDL